MPKEDVIFVKGAREHPRTKLSSKTDFVLLLRGAVDAGQVILR